MFDSLFEPITWGEIFSRWAIIFCLSMAIAVTMIVVAMVYFAFTDRKAK